MDLGYVVFAPGDHFLEHYYTERWYNIFEVRSAEGILKGWYCNITRPALIEGDVVTSEDLELDLFVAPDRRHLLRLDTEEFAALALDVPSRQRMPPRCRPCMSWRTWRALGRHPLTEFDRE